MDLTAVQYSENESVLQAILDEFPIYIQIVAALSLFGCLANMLLAIILGMWRETLGKMVIALSITDAIVSSLWFIKPGHKFDVPFFFGWGSSISLTCCFAYALVVTIKHADDQRLNSHFCKFLMVSLVFGAIASCPLLIIDDVRMVMYFETVPITLTAGAIIYCFYSYIVVIKHLKQYGLTTHRMELLVYPLIMVLTNIPWIILGLYVIFSHDYQFLVGDVANGVRAIVASQGFWNAIAYGFSKNIRMAAMKICGKRLKKDISPAESFSQGYMTIETKSRTSTMMPLPSYVSLED